MELPFTSPLPHGFGDGRSLTIRGKPLHCNAWFAITFLNEMEMMTSKHDAPECGAALHIQARLDNDIVVLNTNKGEGMAGWGKEQRVHPAFPVNYDGTNEIKIKCESFEYVIYFNGLLYARYAHRVNKNEVSHFNFYGDFRVTEVVYA